MWKSDPNVPDSPDKIIGEYIKYYPDIVDVRILVVFKEKASKLGNDRLLVGKVSRVSPLVKALIYDPSVDEPEAEFLMTIGADAWQGLTRSQKEAWVDHLLAQCGAEEDEKNGTMKYKVRPPTISTMPEIIERHGVDWDTELYKLTTFDLSP
jgi:hypothetical protein